MKNNLLLLLIILNSTFFLNAQTYKISGYIFTKKTNIIIENVNIFENNSTNGTVSKKDGSYQLTVNKNKIILKISFLGYKTITKDIFVTKDTIINFYLQTKTENIDEIVINAQTDYLHRSESMIDIPIVQLQKIPSLGGEQDILKAIQLTPGVQSATEGSTGLNVRGGNNSQNLILLDNVPIYNASHLFGFMSVFNTDAINKLKIYKGGFPAYYGGRLSSVVDIGLKAGNTEKIKGNINIGLISAKIFLEGPIYKDKTTFMFSGRTSYLNWLYRFSQPFFNFKSSSLQNLGLYETNIKIKHRFSKSTSITYGLYTGQDFYKYGKTDLIKDIEKNIYLESIDWGNLINYINFEHKINNLYKINVLLAQNKYFYNTLSTSELIDYQEPTNNRYSARKLNSSISDYQSKIDLIITPKHHKIKIGVEYFYHTFAPAINSYSYKDSLSQSENQINTEKFYSNEFAIYINDNIKIKNNIISNIGFRYSFYSINNTIYSIPEPRFSLNYLINNTNSIKIAFTRISQFSHMLSNNTIGMPMDIWVPATKKTNFQTAYQYSLGYNKKIIKYDTDFGIEFFYKDMYNLIDYKENTYYETNLSDWQSLIETNGKGRAYGTEFWLHKQKGRFTGWIAYTLSFSERKFDNINNNKWYPFKYDRRHDFAITSNYVINKNIEIAGTWIFATGYAVTLPVGRYTYQETNSYDNLFYYEGRNNQRMPAYHRLDLSIRFTKTKKRFQRTWDISIYNTYNNLNTYYLTLVHADQNINQDYSIMKRTLFPIIPSISYSIKF